MNILVTNIIPTITDFQIKKLFQPFGEINSFQIVPDPHSKHLTSICWIEMKSDSDGKNAIQNLDNSLFLGNIIKVVEIQNPVIT